MMLNKKKYLFDVAKILKITSHFENELEDLRIKLGNYILFNVQCVFKLSQEQGQGITSQSLRNLALTFTQHMSVAESNYIIQLYSKSGESISLDDLRQMFNPRTIQTTTQEVINQTGKEVEIQNLREFWHYIRLELEFYRQSEPLKLVMEVEYKEDGRQFAQLVGTKDNDIQCQKIIDFMHSQRFYFTQEDVAALARRISPQIRQSKNIQYRDFCIHCPLVPHKTILSRDPSYKLTQTPQNNNIPQIVEDTNLFKAQINRIQSESNLSFYKNCGNREFFYPQESQKPLQKQFFQMRDRNNSKTNPHILGQAELTLDLNGSTRNFFYPEGRQMIIQDIHQAKTDRKQDSQTTYKLQSNSQSSNNEYVYPEVNTQNTSNRNFFFQNGNNKQRPV